MKEKELVPLKNKVFTLAEQVKSATIKNADDMKVAVELLSRLNKVGDAIKERKEAIIKPLNEALKSARELFKPLETPYSEATEVLREKMGKYQLDEKKREEEAKKRIADRAMKGTIKLETAIRKIDEVKVVESSVSTDSGMVKFVTQKVLKITDETKIPREYLIIDERKVLEVLKNGIAIPGAELEEKMIARNYR